MGSMRNPGDRIEETRARKGIDDYVREAMHAIENAAEMTDYVATTPDVLPKLDSAFEILSDLLEELTE